jgi:protein-tyrosine phosphatase
MHMITEHVAVGNAEDAARPPRLMTVILNVAAEKQIAPPVGRTYAWIPFKEFAEADPLQLDEAVAWLEQHERGNGLLICCKAGMGRSVSVVIAYLCLTKGLAYPDAVTLVSTRRPGAMPLPNLEGTISFVRGLRIKRRWEHDAGTARG